MAAVARAGPHRGVKDDEVAAHYAGAGEASPGVIRIDQLVEGLVVAPPRPPSYERRTTSVASDDDSNAAAPGRGGKCRHSPQQHSRAERRSVGVRRADSFYETNAFRTDAAVHRFVPWIVGTFSAFSCSAICSSDIRFASIALIFIRHV